MKKLFTFLLAALMSVGMGWALEPLSDDTWDENTGTLTVNSTPEGDYYHDQTEIKQVVISSSVTEIGEHAFSDCFNLESVFAYDGLQVIDQSAFYSCPKLESVILPSTLREVRFSAFAYCSNLKYVTINAPSLEDYAEYAFDDTHADLKIYVPAESVATYKTNWSAYADHIEAIGVEPEPEPEEVTVVFAANNKTVERTVTLPHTFKCNANGGMEEIPDELDNIIYELNQGDYVICNHSVVASGSEQVEAGMDQYYNDYITIKGVFEGTATVTGSYYAGDYGEDNYSITISIKGDDPEPEPQPAATEVTITQSDFPESSESTSFTKDGVTVSAATIDGISGYLLGGGSFSTTLGNFTKIEVNAMNIGSLGEGWSGNSEKQTWNGNASSVSFSGDIYGYGQLTLKFTIEEPEPEPQPQETVVTITEADYVSGNTITKDGVTLTAYDIAGVGSWYIEGPGTFTNTIGNFTKIEVTTVGGNVYIEGDGWTGDWDKMTWTGNAPTVSFEEDIFGKGEGFSIVCTIVPADEPQPAASDTINWDKNFCMHVDAYYDGDEERIIEANNTKDGIKVTFVGNEIDDGLTGDVIELYDESSILTFTSTVGDFQKIEIYYTENTYNTPAGWTEDATNKKFVWEGTPAAAVNMVKGTGDVDFEIDHIVFIVESQGTPTAVENVQTNQVQGTKILRDGMLLIVRDGKIYNVMGNEVK